MKLSKNAIIYGSVGLVCLIISAAIPDQGDVGLFRHLCVVLAVLLFLLSARDLLLAIQGEASGRGSQITITGWQKLGPSSGICVIEVLEQVLVVGFTKEQIKLLYARPKKETEHAQE